MASTQVARAAAQLREAAQEVARVAASRSAQPEDMIMNGMSTGSQHVDRAQVVIFVWDASPLPPLPGDVGENAENGRGLGGHADDHDVEFIAYTIKLPGGRSPAPAGACPAAA